MKQMHDGFVEEQDKVKNNQLSCFFVAFWCAQAQNKEITLNMLNKVGEYSIMLIGHKIKI